MAFIGVLQRGRDVERPSPSKRVTTTRSDFDRHSIRDGVGMDGKWEYQRVCRGASGHRPVRTGGFSARSPTISILVDGPTAIAERYWQGVGIFAWPGNNPWGPQRGACMNLLSLC